MIHKLKRRFTLLATISMLILMSLLVLMMNIVNYTSVVSECDTILELLSKPNAPVFDEKEPPEYSLEQVREFVPDNMSPEVLYESRYFTVLYNEDGEEIQPDFSRILSVDSASSGEYVEKALESNRDSGFIGEFRYLKTTDEKTTRICFLDCGRKLDAFRRFLWTSIVVGIFGCLLVFFAFLLVSGKIVKPIAESYEKQKRFLSDAGHEIKTPLTIINANVDLLSCDGEAEELTEIRSQTERLTKLTNNLVYLSKMEERTDALQKIEMPLSDIVSETANSFSAPAISGGFRFTTEITPDLTLEGSPDAIRELTSILLENALKYTPAEGEIRLSLSKAKKSGVLTVTNTSVYEIRAEDLPSVFDRFYRTDSSRNSATGGHGIGLSIAKAITESHGGTIAASTKEGRDFTVTVTLPLKG